MLWSDPNYGGSSIILSAGTTLHDLQARVFSRTARSIRVPRNTVVVLYEQVCNPDVNAWACGRSLVLRSGGASDLAALNFAALASTAVIRKTTGKFVAWASRFFWPPDYRMCHEGCM